MSEFIFNIEQSYVVEAETIEEAKQLLDLYEERYRGNYREVTFIEEIEK